jgi:hypothetical protein
MRSIFLLFLLSLFCRFGLPAQEGEFRIKKLLPNLCPLPCIDPAVPSDFTVGFQTEKPDPRAGMYWGSRESITSFFTQNTTGRGPVIQVKLSANVTQKGANSFHGEETIFRDMMESGYKNVKTIKHTWGSYPLLCFEGEAPSGDMQYMVWMGLNSPDGSTLRFYLMLEPGQRKLNPLHVEAWKTFLTKTTELDPSRPVAQSAPPVSGEIPADSTKRTKEANEGVAAFAIGEGQLKILAERRASDNRLLVVIEPLNEKTLFELQELRESAHPPIWSAGKSVLKVYGELSVGNGGLPQIQAQIIPVVIKKVDRFSVDYEKLQQNGRNTVILR